MRFRRILKIIGACVFVRPLSFILRNTRYQVFLVRSDRLGHLALNTHLFFVRQKIYAANKKSILVFPSRDGKAAANKELLSMFIRYADECENVYPYSSNFLYFLLEVFGYGFEKIGLCLTLPMTSKEPEFSLGVGTIEFDDWQKSYGEQLISDISIPKDKRIVTVFARDSSYLDHRFPDVDWSYHSYRNCDINTYTEAIKYLIRKGYVVVRVGSEYSKSGEFQHKHYFEYSLSEFKSDFLDLYLIYKSAFVVGSTSGATDVAAVFNVPFVGVNYAPFMEFPLGKDDIYIQKKLANTQGEIIPFKDVIGDDRYYSYNGNDMRDRYNMVYVDNSAGEILEAVREMHNKLSGNWKMSQDQREVLRRYHDEFCSKSVWSNRASPISIHWLQNNQKLYF